MKIQIYQNMTDAVGSTLDLTWEQLADDLTKHRTSDVKDSWGWSPVDLGGRARANANVVSVNAMVFDIDHASEETLHSYVERIESAGLACIVHSSYTHNPPEDCRARIVLRLSRPVLPAEYPTVRRAVEQAYGFVPDKSTKDLSRFYYLPAVPPDPKHQPFAATQEGEDLDVEVLISYALKAKVQAAVDAATLPATAHALEAVNTSGMSQPTRAFFSGDGAVDLEAIRSSLRSYQGAHRPSMLKALRGEAIASEGSRDATLQGVMSAAAFCLPSELPDTAVLECFRSSCNLLGPEWFDLALDKFQRARERKAQIHAAERAVADQLIASVTRESATISNTLGDASTTIEEVIPDKYTPEQVARWATEQGCDSVESFRRRWIIQQGTAFYVFAEGRYQAPISKEELQVSLPRDLVRAPIAMTKVGNGGQVLRRTPSDLLDECATVARKVECRLDLQMSRYNARTQQFLEAVCPLRPLQAIEHPEVDGWLRLLGGDQTEKLLDWCATVMELGRQSPALYLDGKAGVGKSLLPVGLSRLWNTGGPSQLAHVLEGFNDSLTQCPLVFADEKLPDKKGITATLREFIGSTSRTLSRKYLPTSRLVGAVRVVIAGNNDRLLETNEELSTNDLEAVAGRFLYMFAKNEAETYLLKHVGGPELIQKRWIDENAIAEHALWLQKTRPVKRSGRFLVESGTTEFHNKLATSSGATGQIGEWLVKFLSEPEGSGSPLIQVGSGEIWVNAEAICQSSTWERRMNNKNTPSVQRAGAALRLLSVGTARIRFSERQITYQRVKPEVIFSQAARLQIGDLDQIRARVQKSNEKITNALTALPPSGYERDEIKPREDA